MMSSPRLQKMVIVTPGPQPSELEQKKKRQTLERAKANHLSKQLQMRLQYAKLKVEHGWQRQNLNEVENLYFHHSHLRNMRQGAGQRPHYATVTHSFGGMGVPVPAEMHVVQPPAPSGVPDRTVVPSPSANDASSGSLSPPSQSPSEHASNADGRQSQPYPSVQTSAPVPSASTGTNHPPCALDLSDPGVLARLAQLQGQVQLPSQSQTQARAQAQTSSRHSSATIPPPPSTSASQLAPAPAPAPTPAPGTFSPHLQLSHLPTSHPQPSFTQSAFAPQPLFGTPTSGSVPLYPIPASTPHNTTAPSQPPVPPSGSASAPGPAVPIPTMPIPIPTPITSTALTYDSFWSTHASSTGPTRALYRTHTGFTASAAPGGNVAMLTPGGHAAVMTAEGVYVGGGSK
ncbi:hypothetical protein HD554DRAFT_604427 [Boletus coccyginus]|nr:hypothetical protein HD554DRAFT_604427 [Boletus coccyginus]